MKTQVVSFPEDEVEQVARRLAGAQAIIVALAHQVGGGSQLDTQGGAEALFQAAEMVEEAAQALRPAQAVLKVVL